MKKVLNQGVQGIVCLITLSLFLLAPNHVQAQTPDIPYVQGMHTTYLMAHRNSEVIVPDEILETLNYDEQVIVRAMAQSISSMKGSELKGYIETHSPNKESNPLETAKYKMVKQEYDKRKSIGDYFEQNKGHFIAYAVIAAVSVILVYFAFKIPMNKKTRSKKQTM